MKDHFKPCKRLRQWKKWVSHQEGVMRAANCWETRSKSRQRRRLRPCAEKDKAMEAIPKAANYCHVKLKALPKMFGLKFYLFAKFGARSITESLRSRKVFVSRGNLAMQNCKDEWKLRPIGDLWVGPRMEEKQDPRRQASDGQLAIIGQRVRFKFGDIVR